MSKATLPKYFDNIEVSQPNDPLQSNKGNGRGVGR